jgi:hypothetical protein
LEFRHAGRRECLTVLEKPFGEAELQATPHRAQHHKTATPSTGNIIP